METSNDTNKSFKNLRWRCLPTVFWRWLIEPAASIIDVERRHQARLLTTILLLLIILTLFSLILSLFRFYASPEIPKSVDILLNKITLVTILLLSVAFGFSRSKLYTVAAGLFVIIIIKCNLCGCNCQSWKSSISIFSDPWWVVNQFVSLSANGDDYFRRHSPWTDIPALICCEFFRHEPTCSLFYFDGWRGDNNCFKHTSRLP